MNTLHILCMLKCRYPTCSDAVNSSIFTVCTVVDWREWTVNQPLFTTSASRIIDVDGSTSLTIEGIGTSNRICSTIILLTIRKVLSYHAQHTVSGESQLPAGHTGICIVPCVITYSTPLFISADFHSATVVPSSRTVD